MPDDYSKIFDPQLYFPRTERGVLRSWDYFPNDCDTADQTNFEWWKNLSDLILCTCEDIKCSHVCSPINVPARFTDDYYGLFTDVGNYLHTIASSKGLGFFQTAIIDFNSIGEANQAESIASILSRTKGDSIYLIIKANVNPRLELSEVKSIFGVMKLINLLSQSGITVFVAFCSTEFILWKYAGAKMFATGKFFNLRRFTSSRFEEPSGGGGQLPYWFERNLLAYLREGDLIHVANAGLLHHSYNDNPYSNLILKQIEEKPGTPWLAHSWRSYLFAFNMLEKEIESGACNVKDLLLSAENHWIQLGENNVLMEEIRNNGEWIRKWRIALNDFDNYLSNK